MKHGMRVIDTDLHLIEPLTLWEQRLPEPFRSLTRVAPDHEGHRKVTGYEFQIGERRFSPAQWLIQKQSLRRWQESPHLGQAQTDCNPELYLEGMDTEVASVLAQKGITTRDALADLAVDELVELTAMPASRAQELIMKARAHWFEDAPAETAPTAKAAASAIRSH